MNVQEKKTFDITGITEEERRLLSLALEYYVSSVTEGNDNNWAQTIQMAVRLKHILNSTAVRGFILSTIARVRNVGEVPSSSSILSEMCKYRSDDTD